MTRRRSDARAARRARGAAAEAGAQVWMVGGVVRDRLLGRATFDLDAVVAGDPAALARASAAGRTGTRSSCQRRSAAGA